MSTIKDLNFDQHPWKQVCHIKDHRFKEVYFKFARRKRFKTIKVDKYEKLEKVKVTELCPLCRWQGSNGEIDVYLWLINHGYDKLLLRYQPEGLPSAEGMRLKYFASVLVEDKEVLLELDNPGLWVQDERGGQRDFIHKQQKAIIKTCFAVDSGTPLIRLRVGKPTTLVHLKQALIAIKEGKMVFVGSDFDWEYDWLLRKKFVIAQQSFRDQQGRLRSATYTGKDGNVHSSIQWKGDYQLPDENRKMYMEMKKKWPVILPTINRKPNIAIRGLENGLDSVKADSTEEDKVEVEELPF